MNKNVDLAAIILAAGSGNRYDKHHLKQLQFIDDKTVLYHSVKNFIDKKIDLVFVVVNKNHLIDAKNALKDIKIDKFIIGGKTRQESVFNALLKLKKYKPNKVLIHDSARPNITKLIINKVIKYLNKYEAVIPVLKINDAVKKINSSKFLKEDINKGELVLAQTPQGFLFKNILKNHIDNNLINANDDTALFNKFESKVYTFIGDYQNIKITTKTDLHTIKSIMKKNINYIPVTGLGIDVHKFDSKVSKNNYILLGSAKIKYKKSLIGHSDADVLIHALVDSILGTIAEADIGNKFPNTEKKWKNANSIVFLDYALQKIKENNCKLIHTDITIICEQPKIDPHRKKIQNKLAKLLSLSDKDISVKATTTEKLGYLGRSEGIMVQCVTTILKPYKN
ncbi:MAG: 2-C-methyl-D-erythritol 2,4-cyclodiphosphate synthase [Pelagibacterales bacterium]|nr:2-C-methyl-D-erythritol 2,4-cyclodiphosphate synthase [Pelagibacterales bacterium]